MASNMPKLKEHEKNKIRFMMIQKSKVRWHSICENLSNNFKLGQLTKRAPEPDNQDDSIISLVN